MTTKAYTVCSTRITQQVEFKVVDGFARSIYADGIKARIEQCVESLVDELLRGIVLDLSEDGVFDGDEDPEQLTTVALFNFDDHGFELGGVIEFSFPPNMPYLGESYATLLLERLSEQTYLEPV